METTHDGPVQRRPGAKRYAPAQADQNPAPDAWIAALFDATTVGEVAAIVTKAKTAGAFDERDLRWARAFWTALAGDRSLPSAIALVHRELGGEVISS